MTQYIQYDTEGNILASVINFCAAPQFPLQLTFEEPQDITGKMVDVVTLQLIDIPG